MVTFYQTALLSRKDVWTERDNNSVCGDLAVATEILVPWFITRWNTLPPSNFTLYSKYTRHPHEKLWCLVHAGPMWNPCLVSPLTHSFSTKASMAGRWVTGGGEKKKSVILTPRPEQRRHNLDFTDWELLQRLSHCAAMSHVICLPADDRGPAVSD